MKSKSWREFVLNRAMGGDEDALGGTLFKVSEGSFVDRGDAVVLKDRSEAALKAAFLVARAKFGEDFVIKGPAEFVQKIGPMIVKTSSKDFEREGQTKGKGLTR
ncbi:MAG TPA: LPD7 domain-containing protein [Oligoflexus sp.]|uniref:LPD7 domain-containing protein n=1 Tax=Oligoflexus sp. TaxID=1971216 RepID=UPI002D5FCA53|nr:LPD7 domain-containing protein [Oligoflexus sp.]HYX37269.1 LPD7 domain-containing protein [Oligoflexus sp.]